MLCFSVCLLLATLSTLATKLPKTATKCRPDSVPCSVILFQTLVLYKSFTYLLTYTRVTPRLRLYCDQFFDQIALDRSKVVPVRSQCGRGRSHKSPYGRVAVRNKSPLRLFDRSAVGLCSHSSYCGRSTISLQSPWSRCYCTRSHECTVTVLRLPYTDSTAIKGNCTASAERARNDRTERMGDRTAHA